jgi:hypothetical protein
LNEIKIHTDEENREMTKVIDERDQLEKKYADAL